MKFKLLSCTTLNPLMRQYAYQSMFPDLHMMLAYSDNTSQEQLIEYAGRVCYRSTDRMGTAPNFIQARVREGHEDIIEHVYVELLAMIPVGGNAETSEIRRFSRNHFTSCLYIGVEGPYHLWSLGANLRTWLGLFRDNQLNEAIPFLKGVAPKVFAEFDVDPILPLPATPTSDFANVILTNDYGQQRTALLAYSQPYGDADSSEAHPRWGQVKSATFLFEGISRACTHQLVRHRLASFSQESQRYVDMGKGDWSPVIPPAIKNNQAALDVIESLWTDIGIGYAQLRALGIRKEDARFLLPNATETRIVVTMDFDAWKHFLWLRALDKAAQWEIRLMGQSVLRMLYSIDPEFFADEWEAYKALWD